MNDIELFQEEAPSIESYWRSIILFGKNVASYKFALSKSLLEFARDGIDAVTLEELAKPYAEHICEHLKHSDRQSTSRKSTFLENCRLFNEGELTSDELVDITVRHGFNIVLDAFPVVNGKTVPVSFYHKDFDGNTKKLILTDEVFDLASQENSHDFTMETEARWRLVETAWQMGISRNLINIDYDESGNLYYIENRLYKRRDVTSARNALNGYQKGLCFYCFGSISISAEEGDVCDVDHFFPHTLQRFMPHVNLDGVWNLVLACGKCNRGAKGKFAQVPALKYLERLSKRNEFLISSHHPLRDTLMNQTGKTREERIAFLKETDTLSVSLLIHRWETDPAGPETF